VATIRLDRRPADHHTYVKIILNSISERQRWRTQYEHAKTIAADGWGCGQCFGSRPTTLISTVPPPVVVDTSRELDVIVDRAKRAPVPRLCCTQLKERRRRCVSAGPSSVATWWT
jgi:hypothetical protein